MLSGLGDVWELPPYPDTVKGPRIDGMEQVPLLYKLGKGSFSTLAEGILSQAPYPVKAAVVWKHNVLAFPNPPRIVEALKGRLSTEGCNQVLYYCSPYHTASALFPANQFVQGSEPPSHSCFGSG